VSENLIAFANRLRRALLTTAGILLGAAVLLLIQWPFMQ
jgi:hypothetical protein